MPIWAGHLLGSSLYRHAYRESDADTHSNPCWSVGSCKKGNADTYPMAVAVPAVFPLRPFLPSVCFSLLFSLSMSPRLTNKKNVRRQVPMTC